MNNTSNKKQSWKNSLTNKERNSFDKLNAITYAKIITIMNNSISNNYK